MPHTSARKQLPTDPGDREEAGGRGGDTPGPSVPNTPSPSPRGTPAAPAGKLRAAAEGARKPKTFSTLSTATTPAAPQPPEPGSRPYLGSPRGLALPLVRHGRRLVHGAGCGARRLRAGCDGGGSSGGDARHRPGAGPSWAGLNWLEMGRTGLNWSAGGPEGSAPLPLRRRCAARCGAAAATALRGVAETSPLGDKRCSDPATRLLGVFLGGVMCKAGPRAACTRCCSAGEARGGTQGRGVGMAAGKRCGQTETPQADSERNVCHACTTLLNNLWFWRNCPRWL